MANGHGNGTAGALWKIAASVVTTAIVAIAGFTFSTSRNVAVLAEGIQTLRLQNADLTARLRQAELEITALRVEMARQHPERPIR